MIQIQDIRLEPGYSREDLMEQIRREGIVCRSEAVTLVRQSLDARKKQDIHYICTVHIRVSEEKALCRRLKNRRISQVEERVYRPPESGAMKLPHRPVVVGAGPAGLFAALLLAENGYRPILLERGAPVEERLADVKAFWDGGLLNPESNVQFGEGGAGTFSDGKLNTQVKDPAGRIRKVLTSFTDAGADPGILYLNKPHIGTDVLQTVVRNIRGRILQLGGEVRFHTQVSGLRITGGQLAGLELQTPGGKESLAAETVVLAIGHSARDTFAMLTRHSIPIRAKSFAIGLRIEHPQDRINQAQYGADPPPSLPPADYKLTAKAGGRGVYSFCMCPGGQVVNASSEPEMLAVNGMSSFARAGRNANAALIVTVRPEDFPEEGPLGGIAFQRKLERQAYQEGKGSIPVQLWKDFQEDRKTTALGEVVPDLCGAYSFGNLRNVLPETISHSLIEAMEKFGRTIPGFDREDAVLSGVESRTSSPVRIERDEHMESSLKGLFPCGEGAGYAGGITSAAVDGIKAAEEIIRRYIPYGYGGH